MIGSKIVRRSVAGDAADSMKKALPLGEISRGDFLRRRSRVAFSFGFFFQRQHIVLERDNLLEIAIRSGEQTRHHSAVFEKAWVANEQLDIERLQPFCDAVQMRTRTSGHHFGQSLGRRMTGNATS